MFGYVRPVPDNLRVREYQFYKATYCGLCRTMRRRTGTLSVLSLSYELVLLALVRMLYLETPQTPVRRRRCLAHPTHRRPVMEENPALEYAARVSALLSYYKLKDDRADDRGFRRFVAVTAAPVYAHARRRADLPALDASIRTSLDALAKKEKDNCPSADECAQIFGDLLGEVFSAGLPETGARVTRALGRGLGRFIYLADAAEDYEKDVRAGRYNPLYAESGTPALSAQKKSDLHTALLMELTDVERAMDLLPGDGRGAVRKIIENTVYEGLPDRIRFLLGETSDRDTTRRTERISQ